MARRAGVSALLVLASLVALAAAEDTSFLVDVKAGAIPIGENPPPNYNPYQHYTLAGTSLREIQTCRGTTYRFVADDLEIIHPFYFDYTSRGASFSPVEGTYFNNGNVGITGKQEVEFTPTSALTVNEIYYGCTIHERMGWRVQVKNRDTKPAPPAKPITVAQEPSGVKVSWPANEVNECRPTIDHYEVQRRIAGKGSFATKHSEPAVGTELSWTDASTAGATAYEYRLIAKAATEVSSPGAAETVHTIPGKVSGVSVSQAGTGSVKVTWNSVGPDAGYYWVTTDLPSGERLVPASSPREVVYTDLPGKSSWNVKVTASNVGGVGPDGDNVAFTVDPVCKPECNADHGSCTDNNVCTCDPDTDWDGPTCSDPICDPECENGGVCSAPHTCDCPVSPITGNPLWEGDLCEIPVCDLCVNGTCISPNNCTCIPGYYGEHCDQKIDPEPFIFPLTPAQLVAVISSLLFLLACVPAAYFGYRYKKAEDRKKTLKYVQDQAAGRHKPPFVDAAQKTQRGRPGSGQVPTALTGGGNSLKMTAAAPPIRDVDMASMTRLGSQRTLGNSGKSAKSASGRSNPSSSAGRRAAPVAGGSAGSGRKKKGGSSGSRGSKRAGSSKAGKGSGGSRGSKKRA